MVVSNGLLSLPLQLKLCKLKGQTLLELDISSCQSITDNGVYSIARHMSRLESLGMRSLRELTGMGLCDLFQDQNRAVNFTSISFSGSKNVSFVMPHKLSNFFGNPIFFASDALVSSLWLPHSCLSSSHLLWLPSTCYH